MCTMHVLETCLVVVDQRGSLSLSLSLPFHSGQRKKKKLVRYHTRVPHLTPHTSQRGYLWGPQPRNIGRRGGGNPKHEEFNCRLVRRRRRRRRGMNMHSYSWRRDRIQVKKTQCVHAPYVRGLSQVSRTITGWSIKGARQTSPSTRIPSSTGGLSVLFLKGIQSTYGIAANAR